MKVTKIISRGLDPTFGKYTAEVMVRNTGSRYGYEYMRLTFDSIEELYKLKEGDIV